MNHVPKTVVRISCLTIASAAFVIVTAAAGLAQHPTTDAARVGMQNDSKRESQLRSDGTTRAEAVDPKKLKAVMDQVEQDFKRILTLHNDLARATEAGSLDYTLVADATAEIKKRASRLQTTLALNQSEAAGQRSSKQVKFDDAHVKDGVIELCKEIESFIKNPVIESPGTVDAKQTARAAQDLDGVIELSGKVRKSAERIAKAGK